MSDIKFIGVLCDDKQLVPVEAIRVAQCVMEAGKGKHGDRWKERESDYYEAKALHHLEASDSNENHLAHAMVDLILAVAIRERNKK